MFDRRHFLGASMLTAAAGLMRPQRLLAQATNDRRFLFVFATGGWDPLAVFAPLFSSRLLDMEPEAQPMQIGDFSLVDHPGRPAVRRFFERHGSRSVLLNGISTRSVNHDVCTINALTGEATGGVGDWPTLIAQAGRQRFELPEVVIGGPSFPGNYEVVATRLGSRGQLRSLMDGGFLSELSQPTEPLRGAPRSAVDRFLERRARAIAGGATGARALLATDLAESLDRSTRLDRFTGLIRNPEGEDGEAEGLRAQLDAAVALLARGAARVVTTGDDADWDTHDDNSQQTPLFQALFTDLDDLVDKLASTTGPGGAPLLRDTVVVVLSEMGRTPKFNEAMGRDHWPYTSALLIGDALAGGQTFGGYADNFSGIGVDPATGRLDTNRLGLSSKALGATLLSLAGVDYAPLLPGEAPVPGVAA